MEQSSKLWGGDGRFGCGMNADLSRLNNSLSIDKRLYAEDIFGSLAYAEVLCDAKIIRIDELETIQSGLKHIRREWDEGEIQFGDDDEDVHSVNERRLIEIIGDVGRKLHTGRSRNEQVAVDMKLWMKKAIGEVLGDVKCLLAVIVKKAEEKLHVIMPGYTHLQVSSWTSTKPFEFRWKIFVAGTAGAFQPLAAVLRLLLAIRLWKVEAVDGASGCDASRVGRTRRQSLQHRQEEVGWAAWF